MEIGNMKYEVGDKVRIKSLDWYNKNKDSDDEIRCYPSWFGKEHSKWCGKVMTISHVRADHYTMVEDLVGYWTDEMIEGLVEEKVSLKLTGKAIKNNEMVVSVSEYILPEGYIFKDENGIVIDTHKIVLEKKKKEYPKLFVDCCAILYSNDNFQIVSQRVKGHKGDLLFHFQKLLICRDAYWMVYGEENKLGKPWEPDWTNEHQVKYTIYTMGNDVIRHVGNYIHAILAFPTAEMRDAFYENFKSEIESCKELL